MKEQGYVVDKLTPTSTGSEIVWDSEKNQFVLVMKDKKGNTEYYTGTEFDDYKNVEKSRLWKIYKTLESFKDSEYSIYLAGDEFTGTVEVSGVGFDAGLNKISVNYKNETKSKNIVIRTNGGNLTVDGFRSLTANSEGKFDGDTVCHYGWLDTLVVNSVGDLDCYHEYGFVGSINTFSAGKFVAESGSKFHQTKTEVENVIGSNEKDLEKAEFGQHKFDENGVCIIEGCTGGANGGVATNENHKHNFDNVTPVSNGENGHLFTCNTCHQVVLEPHTSEKNCSKCGYTSDPCADGHTFDENETNENSVIVREQTCTEPGLKLKKCTKCNNWIEVEIPVHHFVYYKKPYSSKHFKICEKCNEYIEEKCTYINNDYDNCILCKEKQATCSYYEKDLTKHLLVVYNEKGNVTTNINAKPYDETYHALKCVVCGTSSLKDEHNTFGENGACSICGYKIHDHNVESWTQKTASTCTTEGEETGTCLVDGCGKTITRKIPVLGHKLNSYSICNIFSHTGFCERCNENITEQHKFLNKTTVGDIDRYTCSCGTMIDIQKDVDINKITSAGFNCNADDWGKSTKVIDGKEYLVWKAVCNSGDAKGSEFIIYTPKSL